ncbi:MAG TPA: hypothetical protein VNO70_04765 [Blastocatellia bacterium]|nr:hypothetical protein [Blastocatellia bacterium]
MKFKMILAALFSVCAVLSAADGQNLPADSTGGQVERIYDRFKNQSTVRLKPLLIRQIDRPREELSMSVEATYKGERPEQPKDMRLIFDSVAERYLYYGKAEALFIVDGKRIDAGAADMMNAFPSPNLVKVTLALTMPFDTFIEIASGKEVELKLGPTELKLSEKDLASLRAFAGAVGNKSKGG